HAPATPTPSSPPLHDALPISRRPAIGRLHDAAATAGAHDVAVGVRGKAFGPHGDEARELARRLVISAERAVGRQPRGPEEDDGVDRKSTRLNSSHVSISYAVF